MNERKATNTNLIELIRKFYWSDAPFWPVVNTADYKSPKTCMESIKACLRRMKAVGCMSLMIFSNPNVAGRPEQVYLCTNEFAASGMTPEEYYIRKENEAIANYCENDVKSTSEVADEIASETARRNKRNLRELLEDFYTSNETERIVEEGATARITTKSIRRTLAANPAVFDGIEIVTENYKCILRKTCTEPAGTIVTNTVEVDTFDQCCDRVIAEYRTRQGVIKSKIAELHQEYDRLEAAITAMRDVLTIKTTEEDCK